MKVLIGTPINEVKDYAMERWIENVVELQKQTPSDLLMIDNSPGLNYVEKVKGYCIKYGVVNYKIEHIEVNKDLPFEVRIDRSQLIIGKEVLFNNYDAWFTWECDQIIPANALDELVKIMESGNFMMVAHNSWWRTAPGVLNFSMGYTLIKRECLELGRGQFLFANVIQRLSKSYSDWLWLQEFFAGDQYWLQEITEGDWLQNFFRGQILQNGMSHANVQGVINPIYHLNK